MLFMRLIPAALVVSFLLSGLALPTQAQILDSYGVKAGFTSSTVSESRVAGDIDRRAGGAAVAFAEWIDASYFSLLTEFGYVQRGYSTTVQIRDSRAVLIRTQEASLRLDYLTLAVLPKLQYKESVLQPYAFVGPRADVMMRGASSTGFLEQRIADRYDTIAFGGTIGVGIEAGKQLLPVPVFLEARYNADVTDSLSCCPSEMRNQVFDILLGVKL
jgi:hypothetical protein